MSLNISCAEQKLFSLMETCLPIFHCVACVLGVTYKKLLPKLPFRESRNNRKQNVGRNVDSRMVLVKSQMKTKKVLLETRRAEIFVREWQDPGCMCPRVSCVTEPASTETVHLAEGISE